MFHFRFLGTSVTSVTQDHLLSINVIPYMQYHTAPFRFSLNPSVTQDHLYSINATQDFAIQHMYTMVLTYHSLFQIFTQPNTSDTQDHFDCITAAQDYATPCGNHCEVYLRLKKANSDLAFGQFSIGFLILSWGQFWLWKRKCDLLIVSCLKQANV